MPPTGISTVTSGHLRFWLGTHPPSVHVTSKVVAVHVDRMVGHGQVADPHPGAVVLGDDQRVDMPGKMQA